MSQFGTVDAGRGAGDNSGQKRNNIESFRKMSEVEEYIEKNEIPLSEQAGIKAKAMKNEGFDIRG